MSFRSRPHPLLGDGLKLLLLLNDFAARPHFKHQGEELIIHLVVQLVFLLFIAGAGAGSLQRLAQSALIALQSI